MKKEKLIPLDEVLKALGDPVRLSVVRQLIDNKKEMTCGTFEYRVAKATFSHHIKILVHAGILQCREEGTRKFLSLDQKFRKDYALLLKTIQR